jgi:biotin carboxyl carrier protein
MTEGKIVEWTVKVGVLCACVRGCVCGGWVLRGPSLVHAQVGDKVKPGDTVMVVESDKVRGR